MRRCALLCAVLLAVLPGRLNGYRVTAQVTYYDLQGQMANGNWVHPGAAACPKDYMGTHLLLVEAGLYVTCEDTGAAWYFESGGFKVDVWNVPWIVSYGVFQEVEILD